MLQQNYDFEALEKELCANVQKEKTPEALMKGYAYSKDSAKATIVFADSEEEIFIKLQNWNRVRTTTTQFQYVNIGKLNVDGKYTEYERYDVMGKNISNVYLTLPTTNSKEEFISMVNKLKEQGAKYNPRVKKWYIKADMDKEAFAPYIVMAKGNQVDDPTKKTINLGNFTYSVGMNEEDNYCTVYTEDGREPVSFYGEDYHVNFATMPLDKVGELIKKEIANIDLPFQKQLSAKRDFQIGAIVTVGRFESDLFESSDVIGENIYPHIITGEVVNNDEDASIKYVHYNDNTSSEEYKVNVNNLWNSSQWNVLMLSWENLSFEAKSFMVNQNCLNAPQLQEVMEGFIGGFSKAQIEEYAQPEYKSWQMELYRRALYYQCNREEIEAANVLEPLQTGVDLKERYERLEKLIETKRLELARSINASGFQASRYLVNNIMQLNHLTQKKHDVEQLASAYKNNTYAENPKLSDLVSKIGKEFVSQEQHRAIAR